MCQFPTTKLHATIFNGAEYIQMLQAAQGSLLTIVTLKNDKTKMSLGCHQAFLKLHLAGDTFNVVYFLFQKKKKKRIVIMFKHLDQKTKFRILFPLLATLHLLQCQQLKMDHYLYKCKNLEILFFSRFYMAASLPTLQGFNP